MTNPYRIDAHQHVTPELYRKALESIGIKGSGERSWPESSPATLTEAMDGTGLAAAVVSVASPGTYFGDIIFTRRLVQAVNDDLARTVAAHPRRFAAVGLVSLPDVDAALRDLEYVLDTLKLDGILLLTHTGDRYLGHPDDAPLYAELNRRAAVVVVHPKRPAATGWAQFSFPDGYSELAFETTRAIANLHFNGMFARFPDIRWLMPHAGGVTPFLAFRLSGMDDINAVRERSPDGITATLKRLYYDIAQATHPAPLRALMEIADPSRILFGTDFPFARNAGVIEQSIAAVEAFEGFDATVRRKVERDNALALFPRLG
ncbi:MAG: amidohydrolase family protein [Rhizobiales bacterium]|nr:amidohydrolase family protein [Hyphomicrobiales bacterium]